MLQEFSVKQMKETEENEWQVMQRRIGSLIASEVQKILMLQIDQNKG